jgi:hypothetical protein
MNFIQNVLEFIASEPFLVIGGFVLLAIEAFLGATNLVKAGSILELILNGIVKILVFLKVKKPKV